MLNQKNKKIYKQKQKDKKTQNIVAKKENLIVGNDIQIRLAESI